MIRFLSLTIHSLSSLIFSFIHLIHFYLLPLHPRFPSSFPSRLPILLFFPPFHSSSFSLSCQPRNVLDFCCCSHFCCFKRRILSVFHGQNKCCSSSVQNIRFVMVKTKWYWIQRPDQCSKQKKRIVQMCDFCEHLNEWRVSGIQWSWFCLSSFNEK